MAAAPVRLSSARNSPAIARIRSARRRRMSLSLIFRNDLGISRISRSEAGSRGSIPSPAIAWPSLSMTPSIGPKKYATGILSSTDNAHNRLTFRTLAPASYFCSC